MKFASTIGLFAGVATATIDFGNWHPAVDGDVRSPCPALNALANHDILPRSGKNYTTELIVTQLHDALNLDTAMGTALASAWLRISPNPASGIVTLEDLQRHNAIEHDGSMSRLDVGLGGKGEFHQESFDEFVSGFDGATDITIPMAAKGRWNRMKTSRETNPTFKLSMAGQSSAYFETAVFMTMLMNATTGTVPLEHIKILFEQERIPYAEGWRPTNPLATFQISNNVLQLALNTDDDSPANTYVPTNVTGRKHRRGGFHHGF